MKRTWDFLLWILIVFVIDAAMCSLHPNLLPTAKLLVRMDIERGEKGHVEPLIGEQQDAVRFAHTNPTVVYPTSQA